MKIDTVLFDMGGTLEDVTYDEDTRLETSREIFKRLKSVPVNLDVSFQQFADILKDRFDEYKAWSVETRLEAKPQEIWLDWLLKDFDADRGEIEKISEELSALWELKFYRRKCRKEAPKMLEKLSERGYKLGIISNTTSQTQVFKVLQDYGIEKYFKCVCLSSVTGRRKPDTCMFEQAVGILGSEAERTAYVGDQVSRDVVGSKAAGYAVSILIESFFTNMNAGTNGEGLDMIDYKVNNLMEIVDILEKINFSAF